MAEPASNVFAYCPASTPAIEMRSQAASLRLLHHWLLPRGTPKRLRRIVITHPAAFLIKPPPRSQVEIMQLLRQAVVYHHECSWRWRQRDLCVRISLGHDLLLSCGLSHVAIGIRLNDPAHFYIAAFVPQRIRAGPSGMVLLAAESAPRIVLHQNR